MNERIKELMPTPWTFPYPDRELYTKEQFEKFAELIVQECLLAISKTKVADNEISAMVKCHDQVTEHFGVKD